MMNTLATKNINKTTEELQIENSLLQQQVAELFSKLNWFEEQFKLGQKFRFGRSSEKMPIIGQLDIFNEAEAESETKSEEKESLIEEITYKRKKRAGHREDQFKDIPVETIEYRLPEEEQVCSCCGGDLHEMSTEVRREIEVIPAQVKLIQHVRYVYSCRDCEKNEISTPIKTAPMPIPALPGSPASASAIAYIMSQKFVEGMPLYRQEKSFERLGIKLSRQTMANWMLQASERWLCKVYEQMKEQLLKSDILHGDETTLQVLHEEGRSPETNSYMWLYRTGRDGPPIILYDYQTTRARKHPEKFLETFAGYMHVDGYAGYEGLKNIILSGCWAHARRKFMEALDALPKDKRNADVASNKGLDFCNKLFEIERKLKDVSADERYTERLKQSRPILDEFWEWLRYHKPRVLPKSAFGTAVKYCLNQKNKLETFLLDGRLEIDNNRCERSVKPFVIGRKGWLFANTARGAKSSAIIYSVVETAKENDINPLKYICYLLEQLPNMDIEDKDTLDKLLPWSDELPENLKVKRST